MPTRNRANPQADSDCRGDVPYGPDILRSDVWIPFAAPPKQMAAWNLGAVIGRLSPHISFAQAQAEMAALMHQAQP